MKKERRLLLLFGGLCVAVLLLAFSACQLTMAATAAPAPKRLVLRTSGGPIGGGKDLRIQMPAEAMRRANPGWVIEVINGTTEITEVVMMGRGELQFSIFSHQAIIDAAKATFLGQKLPNPVELRWIAPSQAMVTNLPMLADVPINSIADIRNKKYGIKISVGRPGSEPYAAGASVMAAYGFSAADIVTWGGKIEKLSNEPSLTLMSDGLLQAGFFTGTVPYPSLEEMARKRKIRILYVTEPEIQAKLEKDGFVTVTIDAGTYSFQPEASVSVGRPAVLVVRADMNDEVAYKMTKAIWEEREFLYQLHPIFKKWLQPDIISNWTRLFKNTLHPGAAKCWKEQGLLK